MHIHCMSYSRERFSQKPEKWDEVNDWKEKKIVANKEMLPVFLLRRCRRFYLLSAKWSNQSVCILFVSEFRLDLCGLLCAKVVFSFGCANVISIGRALARSFSNSIDPFAFFLDANFFLYRYMHSPASHWTFSQLCDVCFSVDVAVFFAPFFVRSIHFQTHIHRWHPCTNSAFVCRHKISIISLPVCLFVYFYWKAIGMCVHAFFFSSLFVHYSELRWLACAQAHISSVVVHKSVNKQNKQANRKQRRAYTCNCIGRVNSE